MERPIAYAGRILVNRALSGSARRTRRRQELVRPTAPERVAGADLAGEIDGQDDLVAALAALPPASARCSSCATSWTLPKPRSRPP